MRTEDDLRAALAELECRAPDALAVLAAVRAKTSARPVIVRRRLTWSLAAAAAAAVATASAAALSAGPSGRVTHNEPPASAVSAATELRQLAAKAATQPTPALGPVLYTSSTRWGTDVAGKPLAGLLDHLSELGIQHQWVSAAARYLTVTNPSEKHLRGHVPSTYTRLDPSNNPDWTWHNPATLPANPAALRRHLLSEPDRKPAGLFSGPSLTPDETVFRNAFQFMASEPLSPAVRASMLLLIADVVRRSSHEFVVLGTVTDRAGQRDIAIAGESDEMWAMSALSSKWIHFHLASTQLVIYFFDPVTAGLRAYEYATCTGRVSTFTVASARCAPNLYEEFLAAKAVRSLPRGASRGASSTRTSVLAPYVFAWEPVIP